MTKKAIFLWPGGRVFRAVKSAFFMTPVTVIEEKLRGMFPTGYPVLCSSGRSALLLALLKSGVSRKDYIGIFPYASHCVLDSISRIATPFPGLNDKINLRVVYHQWGFVQERNLPENTIEDCVDTLCMPGTQLFPAGGNFEIWSLPKILGTTSGGVLWCKDEITAAKVKELRDIRGVSLFQWLIRLLARNYNGLYNYWQGAECLSGKPSKFQTGEIMSAINKWDFFVADRLTKLDLAWPLALNGMEKPTERLPSVIPTTGNLSDSELAELGISSGYRMMEYIDPVGLRKIIKVLPLPIHQEITMAEVNIFLNFIRDNEKNITSV